MILLILCCVITYNTIPHTHFIAYSPAYSPAMKLTIFDGPTLYEVEQWLWLNRDNAYVEDYELVATTTGTYIMLSNEYKYKLVTTKIGNIANLALSHRTEKDVLVSISNIADGSTLLYSLQITKTVFESPDLNFIIETNKNTGEVIGYYFSSGGDGNGDGNGHLQNIRDLQYKIDLILTSIVA